MKTFLKELLIGIAISSTVGIGAGLVVSACIERAFDNLSDIGAFDQSIDTDGGQDMDVVGLE